MSTELRARENKERLNAGGHDAVSEAYRELVDKYYRSLATPRRNSPAVPLPGCHGSWGSARFAVGSEVPSSEVRAELVTNLVPPTLTSEPRNRRTSDRTSDLDGITFAVALPWWGYLLAFAVAVACAWWAYARVVVPLTARSARC